jgi:hypothetical protein
MSISMVLVDVGNRGGKGILVLEMLEEDRELCPLYVEAAPIEAIANGCKGIRDVVEFAGEFGVLILKAAVVTVWLPRPGIQTYIFLAGLPTLLSRSMTSYLALYPQ